MEVDFCPQCVGFTAKFDSTLQSGVPNLPVRNVESTQLDIYAVHRMFDMSDPSGCLHEASKKLLFSGHKPRDLQFTDIQEARELLDRWLELNTIE